MEAISKFAQEYAAGMISPTEFRIKVAQHIDLLFDREDVERLVALLLPKAMAHGRNGKNESGGAGSTHAA
jgi:hypothetical protein